MRRLLAVLAALIIATPAIAAPNRETCEGYPEARVFIEAQAWWSDPGEAFPGRHTHIGTCFPVDSTIVTGSITFDIRVIWHAQPTGAKATRIRISDASNAIWSQTSGLPNVSGATDVTYWTQATIDTGRLTTGRHELRFAAYTDQPGGKQQFVSSGWQLCIRSCSPRQVRSADYWTEGRGWYTDFGYENARFLSPLPVGPVSGTWRPTVQCAAPSGDRPTACDVYLDPNFHAGDTGTLLYHANGAAKTTLAIDTTTLAAGTHRLVIVTTSAQASGSDSGVMVIPFRVAGATPTPTPTPVPTPTPAPSVCAP